jgi:hypothetical protein
MTETKAIDAPQTLRPGSSRIWCIGAWAIGTGLVITQFVIGDSVAGFKGLAALLLLGYVLWLFLWSPSVTLSPTTLTVRNVLRTYTIAWSAVQDLPLGMSLGVVTRGKTITVAAAPGRGAPQSGRAGAYGRLAEGSADVAYKVREYRRRLLLAPKGAVVLEDGTGFSQNLLVVETVILVVLVLALVLVWALVR